MWFRREPAQPPIVVTPPATSREEVELHKSASEGAARQATDNSRHLRDLLGENGFHLKLYEAAGGHQSKLKGMSSK